MCTIVCMRKSLDKIRSEAPDIPGNTCPYIDFLQDILREIKEESVDEFIEKKVELSENILEYIRESNDSLRRNGTYWYKKFVSVYNKK